MNVDSEGIRIAMALIAIVNLSAGLLIGALAIPLILGKVKMNRLYGIRFARSFESDEAWYAINRYGGRLLLLWSIPVVLSAPLAYWIPEPWLILVGSISLIYLIPCIQSYRFARRWNR